MTYKCEFCSRQFETINSFSTHLSHPKSKCKTNSKEYYDKFLRKQNEGICQYCGAETLFMSLKKGYPNNTCKHCKNKDPKTIEKQKKNRSKTYEERKLKSGYYNFPEVCEICEKRFENRAGLSRHILKLHKIQPKDYYDKYLKQVDESICPITGKETKFKNMREGYFKFYGRGNNSKSSEIKLIKTNTIKRNFNVENPVYANKDKRIENFKNTFKNKRELNKERSLLLLLLRKLTINKNDNLQCQFCGSKFRSYRSISLHIKVHNISNKNYYDRFFKKINEGICKICGNKSNFQTLQIGYAKYCKFCSGKSPEAIQAGKNYSKKYLVNKALKNQDKYDIEIIDTKQIDKVTDKISIRCKLCGKIYENSLYNLWLGYGRCSSCFKQGIQSKQEDDLFSYINSLEGINFDVFRGYRDLIKNPLTGRRLELDFFIPDKKLSIEINGLYWHSELQLKNPENYHLMKTIETNKKGFELLQFFEDEIYFKNDIIKSIIKNKLGLTKNKLHARKCIIKEIIPKVKNNFLNENHIQGEDKSIIKLGAFYNNELVSVMTFSHGSISRNKLESNSDWELSRFSVKKDYIIPGAASKLLEYFKRNYKWKNIFSYADLRISNFGNLYRKLGFEYLYQTKPDYFYVRNNILRIHRFNLRKTKNDPKNIPEWKLRNDEGYYRIWDCGKLKFRL